MQSEELMFITYDVKRSGRSRGSYIGTFHFPHNPLSSQGGVGSVMLFLFFLLCSFLFLLCHCSLPPYGIQKTSFVIIATISAIIRSIVKEAKKCCYGFYRPNI
jgi:hypothetical protein